MKKSLVFISILYVSICFSQNLECCKTIQEVEQAITGDWKLNDGNRNVIYRFSFNNNKGLIEVLGELNLPPKAEKTIGNELVIDDQALVNIILENGFFYIQLTNLYYEFSEKILELNDKNFIYRIGDSKHIFIRDKN